MYILVRETPGDYESSGVFEMISASSHKYRLEDKKLELEIEVKNHNDKYQEFNTKVKEWEAQHPMPNNHKKEYHDWYHMRLEFVASIQDLECNWHDESYFEIYEIEEI